MVPAATEHDVAFVRAGLRIFENLQYEREAVKDDSRSSLYPEVTWFRQSEWKNTVSENIGKNEASRHTQELGVFAVSHSILKIRGE